MKLLRRVRRPSPAFIIACLALLVAAGVPAEAAQLISGRNIKDHSIRGKDVAHSTLTGYNVKNQSLTPADFKGSVQGPPGTALAYAHVNTAGVLDLARSKNVLKVTRPAAGLYCFFGTPPIKNVVATLDRINGGAGVIVRATAGPGGSVGNQCSGLETASVRVFTANGIATNDGIYVNFN